MIDTIVLTIPETSFSIRDHDKFNPSTSNLFNANFYRLGSRSNFSCVQNPTKSDLKKGNYKPRLTVTKRMKKGEFEITLRIDFSIPKLLFGNNFDEVDETDFQTVILLLHDKLINMGVFVSHDYLSRADVSAVHFCKNIPYTDYTTPYMILKELSKVNLNQKLDINKTDYRNEGHCLKFHSNSFEIVFYDKLKDLNKAESSEKRSIEKDNSIQFDLFKENKRRNPFEVIRFEVRLNNRSKLRRFFKNIDIYDDLIFYSVFKKHLSQKVLLHFYSKIENIYSLQAYKPKNTKDFLIEIRTMNPKIKLRKLLQMLGLKMAIEEMGIREFRELIKQFGNTNWYRLKRDYSSLIFSQVKSNKILSINNALCNFQPLKLSDFQNNLL